jgi:hypothetical protein
MSNMSGKNSSEIRIQVADLVVEAVMDSIDRDANTIKDLNESKRNVEDMVDSLFDSMGIVFTDGVDTDGTYTATVRLKNVRAFLSGF